MDPLRRRRGARVSSFHEWWDAGQTIITHYVASPNPRVSYGYTHTVFAPVREREAILGKRHRADRYAVSMLELGIGTKRSLLCSGQAQGTRSIRVPREFCKPHVLLCRLL
jgi:hypothetical protein